MFALASRGYRRPMASRSSSSIRLLAAPVVLSLALVAGACSDGVEDTTDPTLEVPEPAEGSADDVIQQNEDGMDLDDGNVPGTERDDEVDAAEE